MQPFYGNLRQDVETVLCSPSVDSSSTIAVSPVKSIRIGWRSLILFTVEMIRDADGTMDDETEDDATDDAAGDDATNNVTVEMDDVLDKLLDNAIEAYGLSPRDVYEAISLPALAKNDLIRALLGQTYYNLRDTVLRLERLEAGNEFSHTIFQIQAPLPETFTGFEVQFKSHWIKTLVLGHLESLYHLDTAVMIQEMKAVTHSSALAGFLYEGFAAQELAAGVSSDLVSMKPKDGTATFFIPKERHTIESPFIQPRERSYPFLSTGPLALKLNISPEKSLSDYFWIPIVPNNPLFDAFVIEFKDSAGEFYAVIWILQITLGQNHGGSSEGYQLIS